MTFVGKILVILIMVFAMFFLAVSTVVFMTEKNWKDESTALKTKLADETKKSNDAATARAEAEKQLQDALSKFDEQTKALNQQIATDETRVKDVEKELTEKRTTAAQSIEEMHKTLADSEDRKKETENLRQILSAVQQQANDFQLRQTELVDQIRNLKRDLEVATRNNDDLRKRVGAFASELRKNGLPDDYQQIKGINSVPPDVVGQVKRVDARNQRVEISIGSDDGLVVGHELEVWRTNPPQYIGRIRIEAVDPDQAVGVVIGKTVQGKKIQEGDNVSPKIRPR